MTTLDEGGGCSSDTIRKGQDNDSGVALNGYLKERGRETGQSKESMAKDGGERRHVQDGDRGMK